YRPLRRKRKHRSRFQKGHPPWTHEASRGQKETGVADPTWSHLGPMALRLKAFPISDGNTVNHYSETTCAFDALLEAVRSARSHVHLEYFIFRRDDTGKCLLDLLTEKAKAGIEVRLL